MVNEAADFYARVTMRDPKRRTFRIIQLCAAVAFFASFFFSAVTRLPEPGWGNAPGPVPALQCAIMAPPMLLQWPIFVLLGDPIRQGDWPQVFGLLFVGMSGWSNILLLLYFCAWRRRWKRNLAVLVLVCIAATLPGILLSNMAPLAACFVWMVASALLLLAELLPHTQDPFRTAFEDGAPAQAGRFLIPGETNPLQQTDRPPPTTAPK